MLQVHPCLQQWVSGSQSMMSSHSNSPSSRLFSWLFPENKKEKEKEFHNPTALHLILNLVLNDKSNNFFILLAKWMIIFLWFGLKCQKKSINISLLQLLNYSSVRAIWHQINITIHWTYYLDYVSLLPWFVILSFCSHMSLTRFLL